MEREQILDGMALLVARELRVVGPGQLVLMLVLELVDLGEEDI